MNEWTDEWKRDQEAIILVSLKKYISQKKQWQLNKSREFDDIGEFLFILIAVKIVNWDYVEECPYILVIDIEVFWNELSRFCN